MRSDSVQSDQKSVQEELEEEAESSQDKKLPGSLQHITGQTGTGPALSSVGFKTLLTFLVKKNASTTANSIQFL